MDMRKALKMTFFVALAIGVGWLDLFFFDRDSPLTFLWFILSGAALIAVAHLLRRRAP